MLGEQVSGAMVQSHLEALRERVGAMRFTRLIGTMSAADQDTLRLVTPLTWIPISTVERLYAVFAVELGTSLEKLHVDIASRVIGRTITTLWKALLRLASDAALLSRSPMLFRKAYGQGRLEVVRAADGAAELRILEWPDMSEFALRGFRVGLESTMHAAGRKAARGVATRTRDGAVVTLEWGSRP